MSQKPEFLTALDALLNEAKEQYKDDLAFFREAANNPNKYTDEVIKERSAIADRTKELVDYLRLFKG